MKISLHSSKRKVKRSQNGSKKIFRSSSEKVQKLKRYDTSFSSSNDEDSISKSSGRNDGKGKKRGRSKDTRSRRDKKKRKKSRLGNESSGDDSALIKKPKRLKKDRSSNSRKKRSGKKRRRRDHSVSSTSSRSRSGSNSERSSDIEEEFERKDKKVESKKRKRREKKSARRKVSRDRLKSFSPSLHNDSGEASGPKRLKSIIVVTKEREVTEEQKSMTDDRLEDEISCKFNDDFSGKSNDNINGATSRKEIPNLHEVNSEKWLDEPNRKLASINVETLKDSGNKRQGVEGSEKITPQYAVSSSLIAKTSEISAETTSSMCVDLESTLRQKALENLLKRQGKLSTKNPSDKKGGDVIEETKPSIVDAQQVDQHMLHDEGKIKFVKNLVKDVNDERVPQDDENIKSFQKLGKVVDDGHIPQDDGNIKSLQKVGKDVDDEHMPHYNEKIKSEQMVGKGVDNVRNTTQLSFRSLDETNPIKYSDAHVLNMNVETTHLVGKSKVTSNFSNKRPNVSLFMSRNEFLRGKNTWKRQLTPQKDCQVNMLSLRETIVEDPTQKFTSQEDTRPTLNKPQESVSKETTKDSSSTRFDSKIGVDKAEVVGLSDPSPSGGKSETNEGNQFQQKTMSVMRGGEMVQVSYKVYIPNKTPALHRRKLKR